MEFTSIKTIQSIYMAETFILNILEYKYTPEIKQIFSLIIPLLCIPFKLIKKSKIYLFYIISNQTISVFNYCVI